MEDKLSFGPAGWIRYGRGAYVRLTDDGERLSAVEVVLTFDQSPGARTLRQAAELAARAEARANDPRSREIIRSKMEEDGPEPRRELEAVKWPLPGRRHPPASADDLMATGITVVHEDLHLERPTTRPFPAEFWQSVSETYQLAASRSSKPTVLIAQASDVPVNTVKTWVAQARKRGHLPEGRRGRAG